MGMPAGFIRGIICGGIAGVRNVRRVRVRLKIDRQSGLLTLNVTSVLPVYCPLVEEAQIDLNRSMRALALFARVDPLS